MSSLVVNFCLISFIFVYLYLSELHLTVVLDSFLSLELTIDDVVVFFQPHLYYNSTTHSVYRPNLKNFGRNHNMWYVGLVILSIDCYCELLNNQFISPRARLDV